MTTNIRWEAVWRWLSYQVRRALPEVMDPGTRSRRSIRDRRNRVERVVSRIPR